MFVTKRRYLEVKEALTNERSARNRDVASLEQALHRLCDRFQELAAELTAFREQATERERFLQSTLERVLASLEQVSSASQMGEDNMARWEARLAEHAPPPEQADAAEAPDAEAIPRSGLLKRIEQIHGWAPVPPERHKHNED